MNSEQITTFLQEHWYIASVSYTHLDVYKRQESRAISDIIDYVANPKKTDSGRLITGYRCV